jgi:ornithine carbamoyltransferase
LVGKHIAVIMSKPSLRTRVSFTVAIRDLGGHVVEVSATNTKLGKGEDLQEWAGVLGRMVDGMVARVFGHDEVLGLARWSGVPVVNALTDLLHPCQAVADAFTVWEHAKKSGSPHSQTAAEFYGQPRKWAYLGDGNNVAHSLILTAASLGVTLAIAAPSGREPDAAIVASARAIHPDGDKGIVVGSESAAAVDGAGMVYTDTWVSMGQEGLEDADAVQQVFGPFQVDAKLMGTAQPGAVFMHCLPAEPGKEVTAEILRGPTSLVLDQAENRLWTSKSILAHHVFGDTTES